MFSWIKREQSHKHVKSTDQSLELPGNPPRPSGGAPPSAITVDDPPKVTPTAPPLTSTPTASILDSTVAPPFTPPAWVPSHAANRARSPTSGTFRDPAEPKRRAFTAALSHPHDSVIAELHGHHPDHDVSARIDGVARARSRSMLQSADTLPTAPPSEALGEVEKDRLFDPFAGGVLGAFASGPAPAQAREELWAHLSRIRELQADVAQMHVMMEGVGLSDKPGHRPTIKRARERSGVGERLDLGVGEGELGAAAESQEEAFLREERDREFEAAEAKFDGRKEGIDRIMGKVRNSCPLACAGCIQDIQLGELAQALATFHALETPATDFGSRSNTMDSQIGDAFTMPHSPTSPNSLGSPQSGPLSGSPIAFTPQSALRTHAYEMRAGTDDFLSEGKRSGTTPPGAHPS
jgi:hypothetical protein